MESEDRVEHHEESRVMGKKIPFPVTKGPLGNRIEDREISQEPEMQELTRLYEGMTEEERRRTQDYLEQHGEIPDNKKQEGTMKGSVTVVLDVKTAKMVSCVLRDEAIWMTPGGSSRKAMLDASDRVTLALNDMGCAWSPDGGTKRT